GTGNVQDVEVTAGGVTVNPDANGDYVITINPGTYDVTATLDGYEDDTYPGVVVTEGNATTGIDFVLTYIPVVLDPPTNLAVDDMTGLFTWDAPGGGGGDLYELIQHDGNPQNGYFQAYDNGYGVVYDVSGYTDVTVEMVDFRHSSWGVFGTWDYSIHIVDWDTYTELAEVNGLQTTGDDIWEEGIDLGSVSESGLVGIFMEPMGNNAADAYPCLDSDDVGPDGMSYYGPLSDYSGMALSDIGDFLMDLWIMGTETDGMVKASRVAANFGEGNSRLNSTVPGFESFIPTQTSRELQSFNVYLDGDMEGNTDATEWQFEDLVNGQTYTAGVEAVYDEGISDLVTIDFTYNGTGAGNNLVALNELIGNYPNPFNPSTTIAFNLANAGHVTIDVYNIKGEKVRTLVDGEFTATSHTVTWDGIDDNNKQVSSGVYFYKMKADKYVQTKKMILMK
ncbi:MAG: T9SS type A sorting domain-containing protein, partial [Candidatus Cloacimonetes bacterium]|nr:T9SS type A sorting domain-containing protein [Candidatus Cloacimonadota bacterium]